MSRGRGREETPGALMGELVHSDPLEVFLLGEG